MCEWLSREEWCDVYLQCDGHVFRTHRAVLASVSNFLREALLSYSIEETPIFIVLPEFDRNCVSSMLYYIYNGEVTIQRSQLKMFLEIINAMQIFIDHKYLLNISDLMKDDDFNIQCHKGDLQSSAHVVITDKENKECTELKTREDLTESSYNTIWENNHFIKDMPRSMTYLNESFSNYLKSLHDHRQRQSFCRDLFIETCRLNGNSNGDVEDALEITNEYYRVPTSRHLTNANAGYLGTNYIVTKNSHIKEAEIISTFKLNQRQSNNFSLLASMTHNFSEKNQNISNRDKIFDPTKLSDTPHAQSLTIDKGTKRNHENSISRITILNEVMQSPWRPIIPNSYRPLRKNINNNLPALSKPTELFKIFSDSESSESHEKQHSRYKCIECHKSFSQLRNFKYHMSIHRGTKEFATTCPVCGKYFNDKGYLSSHMKIHKNRKEYKCSICPKSFNQRVAYNMHMRIHTGVKPHVCEECGKAFSRKMLLKQHLRTHSGERPHACSRCGKRFADRSNMTLHLRLHTGVKPFECSVCSKSFTKKHHLKSHLNFHTGEKPYSCPRCKLAFTQSSNMRTHLKKCTAS
ncbi:unnamed protein product, partial [Brenthis ino]